MICRQFEIWVADLNPRMGTEAGKVRPVLVVQSNLLNKIPHLSTLVCPITTKIIGEENILRIPLAQGEADVLQDCDIMLEQIRAIDNKRLIKKTGTLPYFLQEEVKERILVMFDIGTEDA
jgi:mRNA interferase MazF